MRWAIVVILLAAAGGVALLYWQDEGRGRRPRDNGRERIDARPRGGAGGGKPLAEPLIEVAVDVRKDPQGRASQDALAAFVAECRRRGEEVVPILLRRLRLDEDMPTQPRWVFKKGKLVGYPTLRSAYIAALAGIRGESADLALQQLMHSARSAEESYLIAVSLEGRDVGGWSADLLQRAREGDAANQGLRMEMARFAARSDPVGAAAFIVESAPRGESTDSGRVLAAAATALPVDIALAATGRVLDDDQITNRAKASLVRAMLRRPETGVYQALEQQVAQGKMDRPLRIAAAHEAANNPNFVRDAMDYHRAVAEGDGGQADSIRRRFNDRMDAAEKFIGVALGVDLRSTDDQRARAIRRLLDAQKKRLEPR